MPLSGVKPDMCENPRGETVEALAMFPETIRIDVTPEAYTEER